MFSCSCKFYSYKALLFRQLRLQEMPFEKMRVGPKRCENIFPQSPATNLLCGILLCYKRHHNHQLDSQSLKGHQCYIIAFPFRRQTF